MQDDVVAGLRAFDLGGDFHEAGEIVGDAFAADGAVRIQRHGDGEIGRKPDGAGARKRTIRLRQGYLRTATRRDRSVFAKAATRQGKIVRRG